ncbi:hypothetical protein Tco_1105946 [Tanacetum coccineum]
MDKTYSCIDAKEVATNRAPNDNIEGSDKFNKTFSWDHNKGKKNNWYMFSPYKGSNHGILRFLVKIPWEIIATEKAAKAFEPHPSMVGNKRSCDMSKSCHFHEDHGHETNQYRELRHKIKKAVKSGQLAHLVKGIKNGKEKTSNTQQACIEVDELTKADILQEVKYQTWVANPVMVNKGDRGWRMCLDFTDINKACPKDCYPLAEID